MTASQFRKEHAERLMALLPVGDAWPREPHTVLRKLMSAFAGVFYRIDVAAHLLLEEADPRTTRALLEDWERAYGLPDPCLGPAETTGGRIAQLVTRVTHKGGASPAYFIDLAAALGHTITIAEPKPFMVGRSQCGVDRLGPTHFRRFHVGVGRCGTDPLGAIHPSWHTWIATIANSTVRRFQCGVGRCGVDSLLYIETDRGVACLLQRLKPAHTRLLIGAA